MTKHYLNLRPAFAGHGWEIYIYWIKNDRKTLKRINRLITSIYRDGYLEGIGKPERLRYINGLSVYSRRVDQKNRLVYVDYKNNPVIISCLGHYE